jgi:hypothetical protein
LKLLERPEVLTAMKVHVAVSCVVTPCTIVDYCISEGFAASIFRLKWKEGSITTASRTALDFAQPPIQ